MCANDCPWIVTPKSFMRVKSDAASRPGSCTWVKNTSLGDPDRARQRRTFLCKDRNCPSANRTGWIADRCRVLESYGPARCSGQRRVGRLVPVSISLQGKPAQLEIRCSRGSEVGEKTHQCWSQEPGQRKDRRLRPR